MSEPAAPDTDALLDRVRRGDDQARQLLLGRHRQRLRRMIAARLDQRLAARVDPSDVVQETLAEADGRLGKYLAKPAIPFYPWLRQIAAERLAKLHRRHLEPQGLDLCFSSPRKIRWRSGNSGMTSLP